MAFRWRLTLTEARVLNSAIEMHAVQERASLQFRREHKIGNAASFRRTEKQLEKLGAVRQRLLKEIDAEHRKLIERDYNRRKNRERKEFNQRWSGGL